MSILGGPLPEVEEENKEEPNYSQIIEDIMNRNEVIQNDVITKDENPDPNRLDFENRRKAFEGQNTALKEIYSKERWKTPWNTELQSKIFNRGPLSPHSPIMDDFQNTFQTATGVDPYDPKAMSWEILDMWMTAGSPLSYVGKKALTRLDDIPFIKQGLEEASRKIDKWLEPFKQTDWDDLLVAEGVGKLDNNPNIMQSKGSGGLITPGGQKHILDEKHRLFDNPSKVYKSGKYKSKLYESLNQQNLLGKAEEVLTNLDEYKTTQNFGGKYNPDRPTTGFKGNRTVKYIDSDGNPSEVGWRWSHSGGDYVPYDVQKRLALVARRSNWNINRSSKSAQYANKIFKNAREQNAAVKQALENLRVENPEYFWKIMGENYDTTKGIVYVEHINPQKSPVWKKQSDGTFRHRVSGIAPRDAGNLVIVPGPEFGTLKTKIESILYAPSRLEKGATNYLDFDRKRRVLILRDVNGRKIGDISSITNPENAQQAIDAALRGHKIEKGIEGDWQEVIQADPNIPPHIDALEGISDWKGRF